jgi:hypothetical protein
VRQRGIALVPDPAAGTRRLLLAAAAVMAAGFAGSCLWFISRVPPGCDDPRTLALVRQALTERYHFPPNLPLDPVRTLAGGILAVRFVCEASFGEIARDALPPGPVSRGVSYTSSVSDNRHHVVISLTPELIWEKVR